MTDNFKNPADYVKDHPIVCRARGQALERLYRRGKGNGVGGKALGPFWMEDCVECNGCGTVPKYLLFVIPVGDEPCEMCDGMGRVICGEFDQTPKPGLYGIRGYNEDQAGQEESRELNSKY